MLGTSKGLALGVLPDCQLAGREAPARCERPSYLRLFLSSCHIFYYYSYLLIIPWVLQSFLSFLAQGQQFPVAGSLFTVSFTGM